MTETESHHQRSRADRPGIRVVVVDEFRVVQIAPVGRALAADDRIAVSHGHTDDADRVEGVGGGDEIGDLA